MYVTWCEFNIFFKLQINVIFWISTKQHHISTGTIAYPSSTPHILVFMASELPNLSCLDIFTFIMPISLFYVVAACLHFSLCNDYFDNVLVSSTFPKSYITVNVYLEVTRGHISTTILCVVSNSCWIPVFKEWTSRSVGPVNVNAIKRKQLKHSISINSV